MVRFCLFLLLTLSGLVTSLSASVTWMEDATAAAARAKREDKPLLLNFSGSDWCEYCISLQEEVFSTPEFQTYAQQHLVLCAVDFPRKRVLPAGLAAKNQALSDEHQIRGYPTLILMSPDGEKLWQGGYSPGGPRAFIEQWKAVVPAKLTASDSLLRYLIGALVLLGLFVWRS
jgi:uncharacterized protein YyaL (SSP411 family)